MLPDRVSNPGPLTYESGALPIALRGPALRYVTIKLIIPLLTLRYMYITVTRVKSARLNKGSTLVMLF